MDYQLAEQQVTQLGQQSQELLQSMQALALRLKTDAKDEATARELAMDLREIALKEQSNTQTAGMLMQQMAQYIHQLEMQLQTHPQPTMQPMGWSQGMSGGGGFFSNIMTGLGLGAGLGVGENIVNDIFNSF
ncbi:MAG TPA: hypothetical protein VND43_02240 [Burkholderiales bacterium]|nr:hypothetical protein [Burkholderiales bacterium]